MKAKIIKKRELLTRAAYAERKGVAPRTIGKYVQKKIIPLHNNKIDPVEADKALEKFLVQPLGTGRATKGKKNGKVGMTSSFVEARTEEKRLKVELLEIELSLKKGESLSKKDVEFAAFSAARAVRDKMLNIPDRISAIVAAERDEIKVRNIIMKEIESELESLSRIRD